MALLMKISTVLSLRIKKMKEGLKLNVPMVRNKNKKTLGSRTRTWHPLGQGEIQVWCLFGSYYDCFGRL